MSTLAQPAATIELTEKELELLEKLFGNPRIYPAVFKDWMVDYLSINQPQIPISQVTGFDRLLYTRGTQFPTQPADGQNFTYVVDATNGVNWHFRYNATSASSYKWEAVGPTEKAVEVAASESTASTSYVDLTTVGPSFTVPLAGDYLVRFGMQATAASADVGVATVKKGAAAASDNDSCVTPVSAAITSSASRQLLVTGLAASDVLKMQYRTAGAVTISFLRRWMFVSPVRVSS